MKGIPNILDMMPKGKRKTTLGTVLARDYVRNNTAFIKGNYNNVYCNKDIGENPSEVIYHMSNSRHNEMSIFLNKKRLVCVSYGDGIGYVIRGIRNHTAIYRFGDELVLMEDIFRQTINGVEDKSSHCRTIDNWSIVGNMPIT